MQFEHCYANYANCTINSQRILGAVTFECRGARSHANKRRVNYNS